MRQNLILTHFQPSSSTALQNQIDTLRNLANDLSEAIQAKDEVLSNERKVNIILMNRIHHLEHSEAIQDTQRPVSNANAQHHQQSTLSKQDHDIKASNSASMNTKSLNENTKTKKFSKKDNKKGKFNSKSSVQ